MNRYFYTLLLGLLVASLQTTGQSQRFILFEEATNASCGPCAAYNPAFDALLSANEDKCTAIKYHASWPGYDPMYNQNIPENSGRISYYGISGVPTAVMDGTQQGSPTSFNQTVINNRYAVPSPFNMSMSWHLSQDESMIYVDMLVEASEDISGDLRAHMVVVEKEIHFTSAPGSNGEKDFYDVMKKMLPDDDGTHIMDFEEGDYVILQDSWELANIYDMDNLGTVGFVQDNSSRAVHQACNGTNDPLTPIYNNDVNSIEILNVSETNCLGVTAPHVILRNNGADEITSAMFYYQVNDEEMHSYSWSGSLDFLETAVVELPEIEFSVEEMNELVIYTDMPNGSPDEYVKNDTIKLEFEQSIVAPETINLIVKTDDNPEEITWEIMNSGDEVVASGGPYTDPQTIIQEEITLPYFDCFKFIIYDAGGDGLQMPGFYALYFGGSTYIASGTTFGASDSAYFEGATGVGLPEYNTGIDVAVYPNPARDQINVSFFLEKSDEVTLLVYNAMGSLVVKENEGVVKAGPQDFTVARPDVPAGIYFLKVIVGHHHFTRKISLIN